MRVYRFIFAIKKKEHMLSKAKKKIPSPTNAKIKYNFA